MARTLEKIKNGLEKEKKMKLKKKGKKHKRLEKLWKKEGKTATDGRFFLFNHFVCFLPKMFVEFVAHKEHSFWFHGFLRIREMKHFFMIVHIISFF